MLAVTSRRQSRSMMLSTLAVLRAMADDREGYETAIGEAMAIRAELGLPPTAARFRAAYSEYSLDDFTVAIRRAREAAADLETRGDTGARSTMLGLRAWIHALLGDDAEARAAAAESRRLGAEDDAVTQMLWRAAEAVALAREGDAAGADRISQEAIAIAADTDSIDAATVWMSRSLVLAASGQPAEATAAAHRARDVAAAKGMASVVRRAERLISSEGTHA
jgi:hypothetical protein